jgi:hypothetical protein
MESRRDVWHVDKDPRKRVQVQSVNSTTAVYINDTVTETDNLDPIVTNVTDLNQEYSGPLTYELNSFARAGRNSSWSKVKYFSHKK